MDPKEERCSRPLQVLECGRGNLGSRSLLVVEGSALAHTHPVVVSPETLVDSGPPVEHRRRDEGCGVVACGGQPRGQRRDPITEVEQSVVSHAMAAGGKTCHQAAMARKGQGGRRDDLSEERPCPRETVDVWSGRFPVPVAAKMIRARGVERDQQQAGAEERSPRRLPRGPGRDAHRDRDGCDQEQARGQAATHDPTRSSPDQGPSTPQELTPFTR